MRSWRSWFEFGCVQVCHTTTTAGGGRLPPSPTHLGLPGAAALAWHGDGHAIMVLVLEAVLVGVAPDAVRPRAPPNDRGDNDEKLYGGKRCPGLVCTASAFQEEVKQCILSVSTNR